MQKEINEEGLIVPKKLLNPCAVSVERKNLHRELLFNQKIGKNVLNQKTELQKALQKQKERINDTMNFKENPPASSTFEMELEKELLKRNTQHIGNSSRNDDGNDHAELNEEYMRIRAALKNKKQNTDI